MLLIDQEQNKIGIRSTDEAKRIAKEAGKDLVEINPNAEPPVARIMDYGQFLFQKKKQDRAAKKKHAKVNVKEMKFRPGTDKNDYEVKLRNLRGFLERGDKVKVTVWFRGREVTHQELGQQLLDKIKDSLADCSKVEFYPKLEGRQLVMVLAPKKAPPK